MPKSNQPLLDYLKQNYQFSTEASGHEVSLHSVYNKCNGALSTYYTIAEVESALMTVANKLGFTTGSYIYSKNK